jgi:hypothetical protein
MKKEYLFIFAVSLLILAYVIDSISGPVKITLRNPYQFLDQIVISRFPLTAVGILARSLGLFISTILILSLINKMFFLKATTTFFLAIVFNLFAIQQIATNTRTVTIQWTLSLAYSGIVLLLPALIYLIKGFLPTRSDKTPYENISENDQEIST